MKKIINKTLLFAINKAKKSKLIQSLFEAPIEVNSFTKFGEFIDYTGYKHILYRELRSKIKPDWENMFKKQEDAAESANYYLKVVAEGRIVAGRIVPIIRTYSDLLQNGRILEVGCHLGQVSFALAEMGAAEVTATDFIEYKVNATEPEFKKSKADKVDAVLNLKRKKTGSAFKDNEKVKFTNDDIAHSAMPSDYFDIVCSFNVLEHIGSPDKAFRHIYRVLKKGGISIHEYNPFFSLNGGHSPCTLDFLWGHVRLSTGDFERYIKMIRPAETELSLSFYKEGLNRMTLSDIETYTQKAGLKILAIIPFCKEQHLRMLNSDIIEQCQANYKKCTITDLISPKVIVVLQKK